MIKIHRTHSPKNLAETNRNFKAAIADMSVNEAYNFYKKHSKKYCYNTAETKRHFKKMNHERCSFCTQFIQDFDDAMTVEHIKTKRDFPQKIFQWSNLLCACSTCNSKRGTRAHYPQRYLDPTKITDIEKYFSYKIDGTIVANNTLNSDDIDKAEYMIDLYKLNRKNLVCSRRKFLADLMSDDEFYEKLKQMEETSQNIIFLSVFTYYPKSRIICTQNSHFYA